MRLKQLSKVEQPKKPSIDIKEYISEIESILKDIQEYEDEHGQTEEYEGIITTRTHGRLQKVVPELLKKFELI